MGFHGSCDQRCVELPLDPKRDPFRRISWFVTCSVHRSGACESNKIEAESSKKHLEALYKSRKPVIFVLFLTGEASFADSLILQVLPPIGGLKSCLVRFHFARAHALLGCCQAVRLSPGRRNQHCPRNYRSHEREASNL